jgi:hypothetical protein
VLPDDALFKPVEKWVNNTPGGQRGNMDGYKMPVDEFVRRFVGDILAGKTGLVYRGGMSSISPLMQWLFPTRLLVSDL